MNDACVGLSHLANDSTKSARFALSSGSPMPLMFGVCFASVSKTSLERGDSANVYNETSTIKLTKHVFHIS